MAQRLFQKHQKRVDSASGHALTHNRHSFNLRQMENYLEVAVAVKIMLASSLLLPGETQEACFL